MGGGLAIRATAWPRNGRLGQWAVRLESSRDVRSRAQILVPPRDFFLMQRARARKHFLSSSLRHLRSS